MAVAKIAFVIFVFILYNFYPTAYLAQACPVGQVCSVQAAVVDKLLKSPHSTHIECAGLIVVVLVAIGEVLVPRGVCKVLGGTPIVVTSKAAKS